MYGAEGAPAIVSETDGAQLKPAGGMESPGRMVSAFGERRLSEDGEVPKSASTAADGAEPRSASTASLLAESWSATVASGGTLGSDARSDERRADERRAGRAA